MRTPFVPAALLLLAMTAGAVAGEVLQLTDGKLVPGKVVTLDDAGVTFAPNSGGEMRVGWNSVLPLSRFDLWYSTIPSDDVTGRVALAKWAMSVELFVYARREFVKAKGLGYAGPEKLDDLIVQVDRDEADAVLADADSLVAAGDLEKALDRVKSYLRTAPVGDEANRVRARVPDILARIDGRDAQERDAEAAKKKAEKDGKLKDWIERTVVTAKKKADDAGIRAAAGFAEVSKGNQTRARDDLSAAETGFQEARALLRRVKKAAGAGPVTDDCDERMQDCDRRTVEVIVRWARMEVDNKAWKRASPLVDRGLKIDPVNRELLDLREKIDANWLRRKLSGMTNASGHESN